MEDKRLIEDYLPIEAISAEASREKSVRKGHISTLHLWWARRPLVACRAAVYGALVPADRWVKEIQLKNPPDDPAKVEVLKNGKKLGLNRKAASDFVKRLCLYPGSPNVIQEAQRHILEAHAERLTAELREGSGSAGGVALPSWVEEFKFTGDKVTVDDITAGRAPRPRVLDMFAGGGAIPLEALRLGCEAYALDLNPVAHIIQLCTLVYPQKYGKPDLGARGMTGLPAPCRFWTYVIKCADDSFYIGQTENLWKRYDEHWNGKVEWTANRKPLELIHWEEHETREKAVEREQWLKTGFGRKWLKREWDADRLASTCASPACALGAGKHADRVRQAGPKNEKGLPACLEGQAQPGDPTWGGLADEVRYWGNWVLRKVKAEIGDLYPLIPDPQFKGKQPEIEIDIETGDWVVQRKPGKSLKDDPFAPPQRVMGFAEEDQLRLSEQSKIGNPKSKIPPGYLMPVAYLWTRTVKCKNPACGATVPLVKQTWLRRKEGRYVAMKMMTEKGNLPAASRNAAQAGKQVRFEIVEARTEKGLGFDPEAFSKAGNAACPFCGTVADSDYVKAEGCAGRMSQQMMVIVCTRPGATGKVYLSASDIPNALPNEADIQKRIEILCQETGLTVPNELIVTDAKNSCWTHLYGLTHFGTLFSPRQMLSLLCFATAVQDVHKSVDTLSGHDTSIAISTELAILVDRVADYNSGLCSWHNTRELIGHTFSRQALPMAWDYSELAPFGGASGSPEGALDWIIGVIEAQADSGLPACVTRGSATAMPWQNGSLDAIISDPPYYDNVPYANISDFFYVWLRRTVGRLYPQHFAAMGTPKKQEAVADATRHGNSKEKARQAYERMMADAFRESYRVLKSNGEMVIVYAHKTTLGWSTLVDALRNAGFTVTEAWPFDTEMKARLRAVDSAALASSIFLVARKRDTASKVGNYEADVVPELGSIVRERVETLWEMGISGADLVIACVGAGLRAFTKYARVEYANGEEVPAERFLMEVEAAVLETILGKLSKTIGAKAGETLSGLDPATRFYVLWRYTYGAAELDAGEAIIFANGTHVELDGQYSLTQGNRALLEKKKSKYRLHDFTERGDEEKLGIPDESQAGSHCPTIDALHRLLWLLEHKPLKIPEFLNEAKPNIEQLRLVAQALAGPALKGGELADVSPTAEQSALGKLLANWGAVMVGKIVVADKRAGQQRLL